MKTELEGRTREFAVAAVRFVRTFPRTVDGIEVGRQLLRSACSIGASDREANRAEAKSDFTQKVGIAVALFSLSALTLSAFHLL